jgi:hypothetical protein
MDEWRSPRNVRLLILKPCVRRWRSRRDRILTWSDRLGFAAFDDAINASIVELANVDDAVTSDRSSAAVLLYFRLH